MPMTEFNPDNVIRAVRDGDIDAYAAIIKAYDVDVRIILSALLPERSMAEDAAQETFITAYYKLQDYTPGTSLRAWIQEIARNTGRNMRRKWLHQKRTRHGYGEHIRNEVEPALQQKVEAVSGEVSQALADCLQRLPAHARTVIDRYYDKEDGCEAIAGSLNRSTSWVKVALYRARTVLAQCMSDKGVV